MADEEGRGRCGCCGKNCKLTVDGKIWHHHPESQDGESVEECYSSPDSKRCKGAGQLPEGAHPAPAGSLRFLCRVPSGPTGCGHQVQLTANHRARSHLTPQGTPCAEGSSAPPIAVGPEGYRADTAEWTEEQWDKALPRPAARPEDLKIEPDRDFDPRLVTRPVETIDLPHDRQPDPHQREADAAIAAVESDRLWSEADYEQSVHDGLEDSRRRVPGEALIRELKTEVGDPGTVANQLAAYSFGLGPDGGLTPCEHDWGGADVLNEEGDEDQVTACLKCGTIYPEDDEPEPGCGAVDKDDLDACGHCSDCNPPALFDASHRYTDASGTEWVHPGTASECSAPECCTHPGGFTYGDDDNGHEGSFCRVCGTEEPGPCPPHELESIAIDGRPVARCSKCFKPWAVAEAENVAAWKTPPDLLAEMPEDVRRTAALNPECWDCGHEVTPLVDRFGPDGRPEVIVWSCSRNCPYATGEHRDRPCRPQLSYQDRLGNLDEGMLFVRHTAKPPLNKLVYRVGTHRSLMPFTATVVTPGPYAGREGTLTNLTEEVTCTDLNGRPRPRRDLAAPSGSAPAAVPTISNGRPTSSTPDPRPAPVSGVTSPSSPAPQPPTSSHRDRPKQPTNAPAPGSSPTRTPAGSGPGSTRRTPGSAPDAGASSTRATSSGPTAKAATSAKAAGRTDVAKDAFSTPKQAAKESDKYDNYGRYKLLHPDSGKPIKWTRATTFAKSIQDTFALSQWAQRMTLKGASLRPDIVAAVSTLEVKQDKDRVNALVDDAKKAAGDKVAANKGTAVHAFTEDRDKVLVGEPLDRERPVPEEFVPTVEAYDAVLRTFGLEPVPGLIEFTTAVKQYEVAGTSDRVYKVTRNMTFKLNGRTVSLYAGEYVIGDVKTGADLSYGWQEICIQLALYAQGLNTSGVWSWEARRWAKPVTPGNPDVLLKVRTDVGLIPHLPVDRSTTGAPLATLYAVDLDAGWSATVLCGQVRSWRKERTLATPLTVADVEDRETDPDTGVPYQDLARAAQPTARTVIASRPATLEEQARAVTSKAEASAVWQEATAARVTRAELDRLVGIMSDKLKSFVEQGA
jgi:hypothetical protein